MVGNGLSCNRRQLIHDLTVQKRSSGLSPPEEEILLVMEEQENRASSEKDQNIIPSNQSRYETSSKEFNKITSKYNDFGDEKIDEGLLEYYENFYS